MATPDEVQAELDSLIRARRSRRALSGRGCVGALTEREKQSLEAHTVAFKEKFGRAAKRCPGQGT